MRSILEHCAIAHAPRRTVDPGTVLLVEGERSGRLYALVSGTVEVRRGDTVVAVIDEPGAVFGEMAELLERPHSATVSATTPVTAYEISGSGAFLAAHPEIAFALARMLAQRLYAATTYLVDVKHQFQGRDDHFGMIDAVLDSLIHQPQAGFTGGSERAGDPPR